MAVGSFDFRFVELFCELYALEQYMVSIESQLPDIFTREEEKAYEVLALQPAFPVPSAPHEPHELTSMLSDLPLPTSARDRIQGFA